MKKLINRPAGVVEGRWLRGWSPLTPAAGSVPGRAVIVRADAAEERDCRVALISGGGSGHRARTRDTSAAGCSAAAVLGEVFTSPSPDAVLAAIRAVTGSPEPC